MSPWRATAALNVLLLLTILPTVLAPAQEPPSPPPLQQQAADASFTEAMDGGLQAFKAANYELAMQHFRQAVLFNPTSTQARLDLGTTYAAQVVPNLDTPENLALAANAIETLRSVPQGDSQYLTALRQIAAVQRNVKRVDDARQTELQILHLDPADAEALYTLGVMDWQQAYRNAVTALATAGLADDGMGNAQLNVSACTELRTRNGPLVNDGIRRLEEALELRPAYDDAMTYLNLTYRRKADLACGDTAARRAAVAQADQWGARAAEARRTATPSSP